MGQNFSSEPVVEKDTERDHNDTFNVAVSSCQGWRMSQEDNHSLMLELPGEHKAAFFAVYDGHGSAKVSKHASEGLWRHLVENEYYLKGNFKEALERAFLTFDKEVNDSYNAQLAGTTAVCLLIVDNIIYCANIGDSRGVACVNCECIPLSYDHKPENPQELKRILAAGGFVLGNRVNGNLALSRAFGDFHYKNNEQLPPEQQIVSPCPDVKMIELNDDVDFLVLACDGIWDVLSSEEVVEFVIARLEQNMEPGLICEQLTTRCLASDYELVIGCDNMTVLLVCYTRGRSWVDFCTDIFNKNTKRLRTPRTRPPIPSIYDETVAPSETTNEQPASESDNERQRENDAKEYNDFSNSTESETPADIDRTPDEEAQMESEPSAPDLDARETESSETKAPEESGEQTGEQARVIEVMLGSPDQENVCETSESGQEDQVCSIRSDQYGGEDPVKSESVESKPEEGIESEPSGDQEQEESASNVVEVQLGVPEDSTEDPKDANEETNDNQTDLELSGNSNESTESSSNSATAPDTESES